MKKYVLPLFLCISALLLGSDATKLNLYSADPTTGGIHGCFTSLEVWLGVKYPSWIRNAESIAALVLFIAGVIILIINKKSRAPKKN